MNSIKRELGSECAFTGGHEDTPIVRVCRSSYHSPFCCKEGENALWIEIECQGGIEVSLETLKAIVAWAEEK